MIIHAKLLVEGTFNFIAVLQPELVFRFIMSESVCLVFFKAPAVIELFLNRKRVRFDIFAGATFFWEKTHLFFSFSYTTAKQCRKQIRNNKVFNIMDV